MRRLHRGEDAFFFETFEVAREQDLGVLYTEAEGSREWWRVGHGLGDDVGVRPCLRSLRREVGHLVGDSEGIERHRVCVVSYGVKAQLESCRGAFGGHLVEL